ncbi:SEC24C family protein [Megaselia abdita]
MYGQPPPPQQAWQQPPPPQGQQQSHFPPPASTPAGVMNGNYDMNSSMASMNIGKPNFPPMSNGLNNNPPTNLVNSNQAPLTAAAPGGNKQGFPPTGAPQSQGFPSSGGPQAQGFPPQAGLPPQPHGAPQQPGFPPQNAPQQQSGFPPQPQGPPQQSGLPPQPQGAPQQQPGFPPKPQGAPQQQPGFPPQPQGAPQQQSGFPPQPQGASQHSGLPPHPTSAPQPQGFPPQPQGAPQHSGLPPHPTSAPQPQGFPPQPASTPGMPPQPTSTPSLTTNAMGAPQTNSTPGLPPTGGPQPPTSVPKSQGFPPQSTGPSGFQSHPSGLPPQPQSAPQQQQGFPPQPQSAPQQPGFPPQQTGAQQGFPPPQQTGAQQGFPPQPQSAPQNVGFPPQPQSAPQQQPGFPPQQPGFPPQPTGAPQGYPQGPQGFQQGAFPQQPLGPPGFPQQPGFPPQQGRPGMPPQPQRPQPGMPPQPQGYPQQQQPQGYPPQPGMQQQGYPPQPGMQPQGYPPQQQRPGGYPPQQQHYPSAPQTQKRLDPDQMPNLIAVMKDNQRDAGGTFVTNQPGLVPPLVTTKFVCQDQGNSSPRFIRSSLYTIPATADLLKTTALPFNLILSPFAATIKGEIDPPIVQFGELGPVRCNRCKAYMSPNMQFIDAGRRFQCPMCKVSTEVPQEYFQHLDHTGQRVDKFQRPELVLGTYEFTATKEYCRNNTAPTAPAFVFVIDVSYNSIRSGLVPLMCQNIKHILKNFPVDQGQDKSKMKVGFITYNNTVHFYNIKSTLAQPQMMMVGDVHDMFMPLLDGFLCDPEESETVIDALMEQIPTMFAETRETETILYPAIQGGLEALKAADTTGKLLVFTSSLPIADAPGKLKNRDDRKLLGTDKEKTVLQPQIPNYNQLGQECVQVGCSVDLFVFNNSYVDIATIGQVARLTGGEVFKYTYFQADHDGERLIDDIIKNVSRPIAFDAVMRVRTSAGIRPTDFYGHFFMSNTTDVELASIDSTKSIAIEIKHDDKLPPEENVHLQVALLYTSCSGQRRLRILNLALKTTTIMADIFKSCDLDTILLFFGKQACFKLMELSPKVVKDNVIHRSAQILSCYRKHCTSPTSPGQLILPECLKLLPLYVSCFLKNDAISGGADMTLDDRSYVIQFLLSMNLETSVNFFYPRLIPIHDIQLDDEKVIPSPLRCTYDKLEETGAYILENGNYLFIWLGQQLSPNFVQPIFGVQNVHQVNTERFALTQDTPLSNRLQQILDCIMKERTRHMRVSFSFRFF